MRSIATATKTTWRVISTVARLATIALIVLAVFHNSDIAGAQTGPQVQVNPNPVTVGGQVTITGFGFTPAETVYIGFGGETLAVVDADGEGFFATTGTVSTLMPPGTHPMDVEGSMGSWVGLDLGVVAKSAPPTTSAPSTTSAPPKPIRVPHVSFSDPVTAGSSTVVAGTGFQSTEPIAVQLDSQTIASTVSTEAGDFSISIAVAPTADAGTHPLDVIGEYGSFVAGQLLIETPPATVTATTTSTPPTTTPASRDTTQAISATQLASTTTTSTAPSVGANSESKSVGQRVETNPTTAVNAERASGPTIGLWLAGVMIAVGGMIFAGFWLLQDDDPARAAQQGPTPPPVNPTDPTVPTDPPDWPEFPDDVHVRWVWVDGKLVPCRVEVTPEQSSDGGDSNQDDVVDWIRTGLPPTPYGLPLPEPQEAPPEQSQGATQEELEDAIDSFNEEFPIEFDDLFGPDGRPVPLDPSDIPAAEPSLSDLWDFANPDAPSDPAPDRPEFAPISSPIDEMIDRVVDLDPGEPLSAFGPEQFEPNAPTIDWSTGGND